MARQRQGLKDKERRAYALRMAIQLGCSGAHKMPDGSWAPCASNEELMELSNAAEGNNWGKENSLAMLRARDRRARRQETRSTNRASLSSTQGDQKGRWAIGNIYAVVSGKSVVPAAAPRDTDPDVFLDPDSARIRSRQLGCIGISRRISRTGRTIWMPCTNMSDYSRLARTTALGRRGSDAAEARRIRQTVQDELRRASRKR
jgi:hypothetical protein